MKSCIDTLSGKGIRSTTLCWSAARPERGISEERVVADAYLPRCPHLVETAKTLLAARRANRAADGATSSHATSSQARLIISAGPRPAEISALKRANGWTTLDVRCLPAQLHNRPERIAVRAAPRSRRTALATAKIFVVYADCGTRGDRDALLRKKASRGPANCRRPLLIPGAAAVFAHLAEAGPVTFYLTDFSAEAHGRLVVRPLGLDLHPHSRRVISATTEAGVSRAPRVQTPSGGRARSRTPSVLLEVPLHVYGELGTRPFGALATGQDTSHGKLTIISWRDIPAQVWVGGPSSTRSAETAKVTCRRASGGGGTADAASARRLLSSDAYPRRLEAQARRGLAVSSVHAECLPRNRSGSNRACIYDAARGSTGEG